MTIDYYQLTKMLFGAKIGLFYFFCQFCISLGCHAKYRRRTKHVNTSLKPKTVNNCATVPNADTKEHCHNHHFLGDFHSSKTNLAELKKKKKAKH